MDKLLPTISVTQPVCKIKVYFIPETKALLGVIVNTLPLTDLVKGTAVPLLFLSSI